MVYVTQQDLIDRFGLTEVQQLAPDGEGGIDPVKIAAACDDASAEIDAHLTIGGYTPPLSPTPPILVGYGADIARHRLHDDGVPEPVEKRYAQALKFLMAVAKGEIRLGANPVAESGVGSVEMVPGRQVFPGGGF